MAIRRIEKRRERNMKIFMGVFLAFLMVASGFGIYLSGKGSSSQLLEDHGLRFSPAYDANGRFLYYQTKIDKQEQHVYFLPSDVAAIPMSGDVAFVRNASMVTVAFDPSMSPVSLQAVDLARYDLSGMLQKPVIGATIVPSENYALPVVSCANATTTMPVIEFGAAENESIVVNGSCIKLLGNNTGLLQLHDRFVYEYLGVYA